MIGLFTLDTVMALMIAVTIITASVFLLAEHETYSSEGLYQIAQDMLAVGEKTGDLSSALDGDPSTIDEYQTLLGNRVCFELRIKNQSNSLVYYHETDCAKKGSYVVAKRSMVHDNRFYIASARVWYR